MADWSVWTQGLCAVGALVLAFCLYPAPPLTQTLINWKQKGSFFKFKDFQIFYIDEPGKTDSTEAVVCLHGFPTSSHDWSKILPGLQEQFGRVILLDFLGYGFSDKPTGRSYSLKEQADIVEVLLWMLNVRQVHILSHDYGDTVALEMLARFNSHFREGDKLKLKSLCMLNGGVFPETNHPRPIQKLLIYPVIGPLLSRLTFFFVFKKGFGDIFGPDTKPTEEEYKDFYAAMRHNNGHRVTHSLLQYIPERSANKDRWVGALQTTQLPVHMIYGPADPVNPPAFVTHYRELVPNPSITVLDPSIGHYPQWEGPEEVIKDYKQFLQQL